MQQPVRYATVEVTYNNANISAELKPMLVSFEYVDVVDGKHADCLTLVVENADRRWHGEWLPSRGATLAAKLVRHHWPEGKVLECGKFEVDGINFGGPPNTCAITAVAIGVTSSMRRQKNTKGWEDVSIREIASEVAKKHDFDLHFDTSMELPKMDRFDQRDQSDIEMLVEICERNGLVIRVSDKSIVIEEALKLDKQSPAIVFSRDGGELTSAPRFRIDSADVYSACEVQYLDPRERLLIAHRHEPGASEWSNEKPPSGHVLKVNRRCTCQADAINLAKASLREANKREVTGSLSCLGNPEVRAGLVAGFAGFGQFDEGRFLIEKARHKRDKQGGYEVFVDFRGTVDY